MLSSNRLITENSQFHRGVIPYPLWGLSLAQNSKGNITMKTITYNTAQDVLNRNFGSMRIFRSISNNLLYTEGIKDFAQTLGAYWLIDTVASYMPQVLKTYETNEETFFVIEVCVNKEQQSYFEIYHEGWIDNDYHECITVAKQNIPFIDLPTKEDEVVTSYKFFLELSSFNPLAYTLLLPSEH
jgi:hypothetical protein